MDDHQSLRVIDSLGVIDLVDDAVHAASSGTQARELAMEPASESMRVVEQCAKHELDDRGCGAFGKGVELSFSGTGDAQRIAAFLSAHLVR